LLNVGSRYVNDELISINHYILNYTNREIVNILSVCASLLLKELGFVPLFVIMEHVNMDRKYEYKFVRLGQGWLGVKRSARYQYQQIVAEHAQQGWRLVQIFAPGIAAYGIAKYFELIFERQL